MALVLSWAAATSKEACSRSSLATFFSSPDFLTPCKACVYIGLAWEIAACLLVVLAGALNLFTLGREAAAAADAPEEAAAAERAGGTLEPNPTTVFGLLTFGVVLAAWEVV